MSASPTPEQLAAFVNRVKAERIAAGQEPHITTPTVYRVIDALLIGRQSTNSANK